MCSSNALVSLLIDVTTSSTDSLCRTVLEDWQYRPCQNLHTARGISHMTVM